MDTGAETSLITTRLMIIGATGSTLFIFAVLGVGILFHRKRKQEKVKGNIFPYPYSGLEGLLKEMFLICYINLIIPFLDMQFQ